jgi:hypothetical protein
MGCVTTVLRRPYLGTSACCSLDELGKPSLVEHRSRLPPSQIARASSGRSQPPGSQPCRRTPATPDTADPAVPTQLRRRRVPTAARRTLRAGGMQPWPPGTPPPSESMHRWFPAVVPNLRLAFQKRLSSLGNFGGRRWVRTTGFSLVRRNKIRITLSLPSRFMGLYCQNHAGRCPKVPGEVCTVVPASGSRSSIADRGSLGIGRSARHPHLLTPRSKSELGPGGWSAVAPVIAVGLNALRGL